MDRIERDARALCRAHWGETAQALAGGERWLDREVDARWHQHVGAAQYLHAAGYRIIPIEPDEARIERGARAIAREQFAGTTPDLETRVDASWQNFVARARAAHRAMIEEG